MGRSPLIDQSAEARAMLSRRRLLGSSIAAGVLAAAGVPAQARARRGGGLRLALGGALASDSWDMRRQAGAFMTLAGAGLVFDTLTEIAADGTLTGELAESWTASADARVWTVNLRRGVRFHDGAGFGPEDVIASLALHRDKGSAAWPLVDPIRDIRRAGAHGLRIELAEANADFPYLLSDPRLLIYPAGRIETAMRQGIGTGLYRVEAFEPGVRLLARRVEGHYKDGRAGWFDEVELIAEEAVEARMRAVLAGRVDAIGEIDPRAREVLDAGPRTAVFEAAGNGHIAFAMRADLAPFRDPDLRQALKHAVDRMAIRDEVFLGHGTLAADHPVGPSNPHFAADVAPLPYDPDRARFLLRRAGLEDAVVPLTVSEAAFPGARRAAAVYARSARAAGVDLRISAVGETGYWSGAWPEAAFRASAWHGRATEDWMLSAAHWPGAPWNETGWREGDVAAELRAARAELDPARRAARYRALQARISEDGGAVIPLRLPFTGARDRKLAHPEKLGGQAPLDDWRIAERWWWA